MQHIFHVSSGANVVTYHNTQNDKKWCNALYTYNMFVYLYACLSKCVCIQFIRIEIEWILKFKEQIEVSLWPMILWVYYLIINIIISSFSGIFNFVYQSNKSTEIGISFQIISLFSLFHSYLWFWTSNDILLFCRINEER